MKRANEATTVFAYQEFVREATDVLDHILVDAESFEGCVDSQRLQALATRLRSLMTTDRQSYVFLMTNTEMWDRLVRKLLHGLGVHVHSIRPAAMTYDEILRMRVKAETDVLCDHLLDFEKAWVRIEAVVHDFDACYRNLLTENMSEAYSLDWFWYDTLVYAVLDLTYNGPQILEKPGWQHATPDLFETTLWLIHDSLFDPEMVQMDRDLDSARLLRGLLADYVQNQVDLESGTKEELTGALRDQLRSIIEVYTSEANRELRVNFAQNLQARMYQALLDDMSAFQEADNKETIVPLIFLPQSYSLFWYLVHFFLPDHHADENGNLVPMFHASK